MTLWDLQAGKTATVSSLNEQLSSVYATRLIELGFQQGEKVSCVLAPKFGAPRLYRVDSSVFSLDDQIAKQINLKD